MTEVPPAHPMRRVWAAFTVAAAWLVVAGAWITWGITEHDALRIGMSVFWLALAAVWTVRAVQRLRRVRSGRTD